MTTPSLHRRSLLLGAAALGVSGWPRIALASAVTEARLVLVILRGGLDGLAAVQPLREPDLADLRGPLALTEKDGLIPLDGRFGLHPKLGGLAPWWQEGSLGIVHAVASPYRERSHFDAQDLLENGTTKPMGRRDGWLNRTLALMGGDGRRLGVALGQSVPLVLRGDQAAVASWAPSVLPDAPEDLMDRIMALAADDPLFGPALTEGLAAAAMADHAMGETEMDTMTADGPLGGRRRLDPTPLFAAAGKLLADPAGPRVAVVEMGGWDTHAGQVARLQAPLERLAGGLLALRTGLGEAWGRTAILVVTEFGRTVRLNGSNGTDHGTAGVALVAGGAVAGGGSVRGEWPGLSGSALYQGRDLAPTTDLRSLLKGVLLTHLDLPAQAIEGQVFPDSGSAKPLRDLIAA